MCVEEGMAEDQTFYNFFAPFPKTLEEEIMLLLIKWGELHS